MKTFTLPGGLQGPPSAAACESNRLDDRSERVESERWKSFIYDELTARDKANLDITWLRDESLEDADNLPRRRSSPARSSRTSPPL